MKVSLFKKFLSVGRNRFKKYIDGLPLCDGFDYGTERSGASGKWSCKAGEEQRWTHGSTSNGESFSWGDFA